MDYRTYISLGLKKKLKSFLIFNTLGGFSFLESTGCGVRKASALCLSAGLDSTLLLNTLVFSKNRFTLIYFNHNKRVVGSSKEQTYVFLLSKIYNLPFYSSKIEVGVGLKITQGYLKMFRDFFFNKITYLKKIQTLFTAHHMDDNLEGVLLNLSFNVNSLPTKLLLKGYSGMCVQRPIFWMLKNEVLGLMKKYRVFFFNDQSNYSVMHSRNFIRFKVLPLLKNTYCNSKNTGFCLKKNFLKSLVTEKRIAKINLIIKKTYYNFFLKNNT